MSKAKIELKAKATEEFVDKIKKAKSFLVFEYLGLTVKELTEMRAKLHAEGASIEVVKNNQPVLCGFHKIPICLNLCRIIGTAQLPLPNSQTED